MENKIFSAILKFIDILRLVRDFKYLEQNVSGNLEIKNVKFLEICLLRC